MTKIKPSEITPQHIYVSRRKFIAGVSAVAASSLLLSACSKTSPSPIPSGAEGTAPAPSPAPLGSQILAPTPAGAGIDDLGAKWTTEKAINSYNNFYEFTVAKEGVAGFAQRFKTSPWEVEVGGLVRNPRTFDIDDLLNYDQEERVYRMRCVEGWSMVIPWLGFPLAKLLQEVEPLSGAQYVRFETLYDPEQMPGQENSRYPWPYVEGLRLDEAMHDLTLLSTGLYGQPLLPQTGAPIRLVLPWKYGFKSIKSIVRIDLVEEAPVSLWMDLAPREYGFFANVNPDVDHPRWSQATERRIGEGTRRRTLPFNGYGEQVAHLYQGMDLSQWY